MNDSNKAALGLTPMTVEINSSKYANGCHFDSADTVSIEVKWNKHLYPHLQGYCIYVWQGTPPWYVGNVLYRANLDSPYFQSMLDDDIFYRFIRSPNITNFTVTGLTPNLRYLIGVSAICCSIALRWSSSPSTSCKNASRVITAPKPSARITINSHTVLRLSF